MAVLTTNIMILFRQEGENIIAAVVVMVAERAAASKARNEKRKKQPCGKGRRRKTNRCIKLAWLNFKNSVDGRLRSLPENSAAL